MSATPKYAIAEIERRWLVELQAVGPLEDVPFRDIQDLYFPGTALRLRKVENPSGETVYKFCKKYGKASALSEPTTNLYLSEAEYRVLAQIAGWMACKRRYGIAGGALDLYAHSEFAVFEVEFQSEAEAEQYAPPSFVREEVTNNTFYSWAELALRGA
jgi:CYTH domain-containing protein